MASLDSPTSSKTGSFTEKIFGRRSYRSKAHHKEAREVPKRGFDLDSIPLDASRKVSAAGELGRRKQVVVVAIDFGTTYSGYAYSLMNSPDDIYLMNSGQVGQTTTKVPTALLLNDHRVFHSFGFEARETYHDLDEAESRKWLYFEKFKMELHSRKELSRKMELEASNGQRVLAYIVFGHALRYFKDSCLRTINECLIGGQITAENVQWVITVPAIWRQSAKQFMRYAASEAGLVTADYPKQLIIALEPEAASICCQKLRLQECVPDPHGSISPSDTPSPSTGAPKFINISHTPPTSTSSSSPTSRPHTAPSTADSPGRYAADFRNGVQYLVADCGGGTVDLTIHELEGKGELKELYKATGGAWGSMGVDYQFEVLLLAIFGEEFLLDFVKSRPVSWLELLSVFEAKKRGFSPHKQLSVNLSLPFVFIEQYRKKTGKCIEATVRAYEDAGVQWSHQGMLRLLPSVMMSLFEPIVSAIIHHIQKLLLIPELSNVDYLFLVGGFAESAVLQEGIRNAFRASTMRVIIPQDVSLAILKGAVMFGHNSSIVRIRRSALTYGVGCLNRFIPGKNPLEKRVVKDGAEWCTGVFDAFVFSNQAVPLGHAVTRSYSLAQVEQHSTVITLFSSENDKVYYVSDPGCYKVGELKLDLPDILGGKRRELKMSMIFGNTEISVEAIDMTSKKTAHASIDFLDQQSS